TPARGRPRARSWRGKVGQVDEQPGVAEKAVHSRGGRLVAAPQPSRLVDQQDFLRLGTEARQPNRIAGISEAVLQPAEGVTLARGGNDDATLLRRERNDAAAAIAKIVEDRLIRQ